MTSQRSRDAYQLLLAEGLVPRDDGFPIETLLTFAAERGWATSTEPVARPTPTRRWRATAFLTSGAKLGWQKAIGGSVAYGATEGEALMVVIAAMVRRQQR